MKPKRRKPNSEERAQGEAALQLLRERIAHHEAKLAAERRDSGKT